MTDFTTDNFPGVIDANQWVEDARWDVAGPTSARFQRDKISAAPSAEQHSGLKAHAPITPRRACATAASANDDAAGRGDRPGGRRRGEFRGE